jgi:hypothetical protein
MIDGRRRQIAILSAFYEPFMSGAEQLAKEILERLGDRYDLVLIAARLDKSLPKQEQRAGFKIVRVGIGHKLIDKFLYPVLAAWQVRRERPEVVQAIMESYAGGALVLAKYLYPRAKRILSLQSGDLDHDQKQSHWHIRMFWQLIHRSPDLVTPISEFLAQRERRLGVPEDKILELKGEYMNLPVRRVNTEEMSFEALKYISADSAEPFATS